MQGNKFLVSVVTDFTMLYRLLRLRLRQSRAWDTITTLLQLSAPVRFCSRCSSLL